MRSAAAHLSALVFFGALAVLFTWPLPQVLTTASLGRGAGDNLVGVWTFWSVRTALAADRSVFWTPDLFAPIGTSLVTHILTPLLTVPAAFLPFQPVLLYNVALVGTVFLNFAIAYAAAHKVTRDPLPSVFAAVAFGGAPFLLARSYGHLNLLSAWGLPLLLIATLGHERRPSAVTALGLAGAIGLLAYTDYYYLIFGLLLVVLHLSLSCWPIQAEARPLTPGRGRALSIIGGLIVIAGAVVAWIHATGGVDTVIGGVRLRMTDTFNPRVALGFLLAAALLTWKRPVITLSRRQPSPAAKAWRLLPLTALTSALLLGPILIAGAQLWLAGDYATQTYFWRSAPPGLDLAPLLLGNPLGWVSGSWTTSALEHLEINQMEGAAWPGLAPMALLVWAIRKHRVRPDVRAYLWIAGVFFIWSLGPYLRVLGANTGFMLPQTLIRFIPVVGNARIPGRAIVVVQLMVAVLGAIALASIPRPRRATIGVAAVVAVLLDFWPRPHPTLPLERPALYAALRAMPPGIVLEIPLGITDGFGTRGAFDFRSLFYQTLHEHPLMGGTVSRMSPRTRAAFESDPLVGPILDLSEGLTPRIGGSSARRCRQSLACDVRYVVIDDTAASRELKDFVESSFRLQSAQRDAGRALYRVEGVPSCDCADRAD